MRLMNVTSLDIEEFFGDDIPEYAILSHTWGPQEVSLQEWSRRQEPSVSSKAGCQKILSACRLASAHDLEYVWIDTNCIDKTSSAELSEAINSMFDWYRVAQICFVHLQDVIFDPESAVSTTISLTELFQSSRWFSRGWTLQELLAPQVLHFYDKNWTHITDKRLCLEALSVVTSIPIPILQSQANIRGASTAQRMSWLSRRKTTRREDMAYCMFGIFGVNLPLLYGEGHKAFTRLQEELIRSSYDHTIFCWAWPEHIVRPEWIPVFAPCAAAFTNSGKYIQRPSTGVGKVPAEYSLTNVGLRIQLPVLCSSPVTCYAILNVYIQGRGMETCVAIPLRQPTTIWTSETIFWRTTHPNGPVVLPYEWVGTELDLRLAKHGMLPTDLGINNDGLLTLHRRGVDYWPRIPHSRFALLTLERLGAGFPIQPPCTRCCTDGGVIFLKPISVPGIWCCKVELFRQNEDQVPDSITVVVQELKGNHNRPRWSVTRSSIVEVEQQAVKDHKNGSLYQDWENLEPILQFTGKIGGDIPVAIASNLEMPRATLGVLADVNIAPFFIWHTHHYKGERASGRILGDKY